MFTAERPALVLLDVNMPGIDGYETARRIRAARPEEWVPIIFLSANEEDQDLERAIECGGDDYLVKPVSVVVLGRQDPRAAAARPHAPQADRGVKGAECGEYAPRDAAQQDGLTGIANRRAFES